MPTIQKRHNRSGTISFIAWVRIKPFKPMSKAFSTREAAKDWAEDQARQLREDRRSGAPASDLTQLTLSELIQEYLGDPETQKLSSLDGYERLLSWWKDKYGAQRVLELGARALRAARGDLLVGWAALGFVDTLFRAMMLNEVRYGSAKFLSRVQV